MGEKSWKIFRWKRRSTFLISKLDMAEVGGEAKQVFFDSIRLEFAKIWKLPSPIISLFREQIFIRKIYLIKSFDIQSLISRFLNFENFAIQLDNLCISQSRYPNGRSSELSCVEILRIVSSNAIERRKNLSWRIDTFMRETGKFCLFLRERPRDLLT